MARDILSRPAALCNWNGCGRAGNTTSLKVETKFLRGVEGTDSSAYGVTHNSRTLFQLSRDTGVYADSVFAIPSIVEYRQSVTHRLYR